LRAEAHGRAVVLLSDVLGSRVKEQVLADHRDGALSLSWQPDGKAIAFYGRDRGAGTSLYLVDTQIGGAHKVVGNVQSQRAGPTWLSDRKGGFVMLVVKTNDQLVMVTSAGVETPIATRLIGHGEVAAKTLRKVRTIFVTALGRQGSENAILRYRKIYKIELD
jgi:dipeptidyl aminopeptidase/acylaminoacyl peptidase